MEWLVGLGIVALVLMGGGRRAAPDETPTPPPEDPPPGDGRTDAERVLDDVLDLGKKGAPLLAGLAGKGLLGGATGGAVKGLGAGGGATAGTATTGTAGGGAGAATTAGAQAALASQVAVGAFVPLAVAAAFIIAAEIVKAQERFKDLLSRLRNLGPNAAGLNRFETAMLKLEFDRLGIGYREVVYRDPRMVLRSQGSGVQTIGLRSQLEIDFAGLPADKQAIINAGHLGRAARRARQAAFEYLKERGYWAGRISRQRPGGTSIPSSAWEPANVSYEDIEPGLGGLEQVPSPLDGPISTPADPENPAPSRAEMVARFGAAKPGVDCPDDVLAMARVWGLLEAMATARAFEPNATAQRLSEMLGGGLPAASLEVRGSVTLRLKFAWNVFNDLDVNTVTGAIGRAAGPAFIDEYPRILGLVPEAVPPALKFEFELTQTKKSDLTDVRKLKGTFS